MGRLGSGPALGPKLTRRAPNDRTAKRSRLTPSSSALAPSGCSRSSSSACSKSGAHVIDSLPHVGGQCVELYPDKPIYDLPGLPVHRRELAERLLQQTRPFAPEFHLGQEVSTVARQADGRFSSRPRAARLLTKKVVFIAGASAASQPRRLRIEGIRGL